MASNQNFDAFLCEKRLQDLFSPVTGKNPEPFSTSTLTEADQALLKLATVKPENILSGTKRYLLPYHGRFKKLLDINQTQRTRFYMTSEFIQVLGELEGHENKSALEPLLSELSDRTSKEIRDSAQDLIKIYGEAPPQGKKYDLYLLDKRAESFNLRDERIQTVDAIDEGLKKIDQTFHHKRGLSEMSPRELRLRYEIAAQKGLQASENYSERLNTKTKAHYRIEESHTDTDKDGNQHTHYSTQTVVPTYADILNHHFRKGDGSTWGRRELIRDTEAVRNKENFFREGIADGEKKLLQTLQHWTQPTESSPPKKQMRQELEALFKDLQDKALMARDYSRWSEEQILRQWNQDDPFYFHERNGLMAQRLERAAEIARLTLEQMAQDQRLVRPVIPKPKYPPELQKLWNEMMLARASQIAVGVGAAGAGLYWALNNAEPGANVRRSSYSSEE